jgi:hypothetical protein
MLAGRMIPVVLLSILVPCAIAIPTTAPSSFKQFAGKTVFICYLVDVDGDGEATWMETRYLADRLKEAGAKVVCTAPERPTAGDVLVLGEPPGFEEPAYRTFAGVEAELRDYRDNREKLASAAKAGGMTVVESDAVATFFGLKQNPEDLRRDVLRRTADALDRKVPDQHVAATFEDIVTAVREREALNLYVEWNALQTAGIDAKQKIDSTIKETTALELLKLLMKALSENDLLTVMAWNDGTIVLTTKENADDCMKKSEEYLRISELRDPPDHIFRELRLFAPLRTSQLGTLKLESVPRSKIIEHLQRESGISIVVEWEKLEWDQNATRSLKSYGRTTLLEAMRAMFYRRVIFNDTLEVPKEMMYVRKDGAVVVTTRDAAFKAKDVKAMIPRVD